MPATRREMFPDLSTLVSRRIEGPRLRKARERAQTHAFLRTRALTMVCSICSKDGHNKSTCPNTVTCGLCGEKGHNKATCKNRATIVKTTNSDQSSPRCKGCNKKLGQDGYWDCPEGTWCAKCKEGKPPSAKKLQTSKGATVESAINTWECPRDYRSWIRYYKDEAGCSSASSLRCSAKRCPNEGTDGAHVWYRKRLCIIPACRQHNKARGASGNFDIIAGLTVVTAPPCGQAR